MFRQGVCKGKFYSPGRDVPLVFQRDVMFVRASVWMPSSLVSCSHPFRCDWLLATRGSEVIPDTDANATPGPDSDECNTDTQGCVTSPNFPSNYPPRSSCTIPRSFGKINVKSFATEARCHLGAFLGLCYARSLKEVHQGVAQSVVVRNPERVPHGKLLQRLAVKARTFLEKWSLRLGLRRWGRDSRTPNLSGRGRPDRLGSPRVALARIRSEPCSQGTTTCW